MKRMVLLLSVASLLVAMMVATVPALATKGKQSNKAVVKQGIVQNQSFEGKNVVKGAALLVGQANLAEFAPQGAEQGAAVGQSNSGGGKQSNKAVVKQGIVQNQSFKGENKAVGIFGAVGQVNAAKFGEQSAGQGAIVEQSNE